ncbi:hypothetical protein [Niallia taxi]|uniref:oxidoreductase n=1 Tax=Niallia taxi TaxID=2499688 RepID=UPI00119F1BAC
MNILNEPIQLKSGVIIPNRIVMAPMTSKGSSWDGIIEEEDLKFYQKRNQVAGLIITGATAVSELGENFSYQMSIYDDRFIPGLSKLAKLIKGNGNKAVVQLYHSGANSKVSYQKHGKVVAPSLVDFPHLPYIVSELTDEEIWSIIKDFGQATIRAIKAGFDGVEIHGAYSHLIQQFFSTYSNKRVDYWGGTLEKRMNFALEIVKEVQNTVEKYAQRDFIIGFRIMEEEFHWGSTGYDFQDTLKLIDRLSDTNIDYIHGTTNRYGKLFKEVIEGRTALIIVPHASSAEDALKGLEYGDMISIARAALIEPYFAQKIREGKVADMATEITSTEMVNSLGFPSKLTKWMLDPMGLSIVPKGMNYFK